MAAPAPRPSEHVLETLKWLGSLAETRLAGTEDERRVQDAIGERLEAAGYQLERQPFRFPRHIYGSMALHFGLALAFLSVPWPAVAAVAHLVIGVSFFMEVTRRGHLLRSLWPKIETQNLLATFPASSGTVRRRLVLLAHADSAFTGVMFEPRVLRVMAAPPPKILGFLGKQLRLPLAAVFALAAFELAATFVDLPRWPAALLAIPAAIAFVVNLDVVLRNRPVPGAADNLSGCAAQVVLAEAWAKKAAPDVEVVFVFTGCEEAGTGGASHLAKTMRGTWARTDTDVVVLDTLSNGTLHQLEEGELVAIERPPSLVTAVDQAAEAVGHPPIEGYMVPAGATDALPFLVEGYRALALTCIDPEIHAPRHYHHPTDTVDNVEPEQLARSTDVAERLIDDLAAAALP